MKFILVFAAIIHVLSANETCTPADGDVEWIKIGNAWFTKVTTFGTSLVVD